MTIQAVWALTLAASLTVAGCSDPHGKSTSEPEKDPGVYYRMKVGLTYKGQPVDIDFVAGCNVHLGRDLSGGSIEEINGMTDLFRGVRMPEGHAVVINTFPIFEGPQFNPCNGDTTDHSSSKGEDDRVPQDWLPFIQWFERDDEFAHGIGYMTQDAYENKSARFGFRFARIEHATREEFERFRKTGPANLLPPHQTNWIQGRPDPIYYYASEVPNSVRKNPPSGWWHTSGRWCQGIIRWRPTDGQRALLRRAWPLAKPEYWTIADGRPRFNLAAEATKPNDAYANGHIRVSRFVRPYTADKRASQPQIFPMEDSQSLSVLQATTSPIQLGRVQLGNGEIGLGFVTCDVQNGPILEAVTGTPWKPGYDVTIDGTAIYGAQSRSFSDRDFSPLFQRDEYVISILQSFRG